MNAQGGVDPTDWAAMDRAALADLVTLPESVLGTNCGNCKFVTSNGAIGYCAHPAVLQPVTARMCCALWDAPGTRRPWLR